MKSSLVAIVLGVVVSLSAAVSRATPYQDGDLVFHESTGEQARAIHEATGSRWSHVGLVFRDGDRWLVIEAVQPVRVTTLAAFIARGKNRDYRITRRPGLTDAQKRELRAEAQRYVGKNYDIYFEWSDDLIYCSELVYKVFRAAAGVEIGVVQKFRDLRLDGPYAQELIRRRLAGTGRTLDLDEPIVTPASQAADPRLVLVESSL